MKQRGVERCYAMFLAVFRRFVAVLASFAVSWRGLAAAIRNVLTPQCTAELRMRQQALKKRCWCARQRHGCRRCRAQAGERGGRCASTRGCAHACAPRVSMRAWCAWEIFVQQSAQMQFRTWLCANNGRHRGVRHGRRRQRACDSSVTAKCTRADQQRRRTGRRGSGSKCTRTGRGDWCGQRGGGCWARSCAALDATAAGRSAVLRSQGERHRGRRSTARSTEVRNTHMLLQCSARGMQSSGRGSRQRCDGRRHRDAAAIATR